MQIVSKVRKIPKRIYREIESKKYREGKYSKYLKIMSSQETMNFLVDKKDSISFCRFGDGEIAIMKGESIAFQHYDEELAIRLKNIMNSDEKDLMIGINYFYLNPMKGINKFTYDFLNAMGKQRKYLIKNCNHNKQYIDAAFTQMYQNYEEYDFEQHFAKVEELFRGKDITLICGEGILDSIEFSPFQFSNSVEYLYAPSKDAFSDYSVILEKAKRIQTDRTICIILGPTAKVLVYDLYNSGRLAWDIGHFIKDYDAYKKAIPKSDDNLLQFFKPD